MGAIKYYLGAAYFTLLLVWLGYFAAIIITVMTVAAALGLYFRRQHVNRLKKYGRRIDNIYVVARHPKFGEVDLPGLNKYLVSAHPFELLIQARREEGWLRKAGNNFFENDELPSNQQLKVLPIAFKDGQHVNETWEEYCQRVRYTVSEDRANRHETLKRANGNWYDKHGLNQKGVIEWEL